MLITSTTSFEEAKEFDGLQYENKLVFVPFDSNLKSAYKIAYEDKGDGVTIGMACNKIADGRLSDFDIIKFLFMKKIILGLNRCAECRDCDKESLTINGGSNNGRCTCFGDNASI